MPTRIRLTRLLFPAAALIVAGIALLVYLPTVAPTITWQNGGADSGELAAAVALLGIPHPPGYPAYVLLGRLWLFLPLGKDIAYRLNLFSAFSAALAGGITTWIGLTLANTFIPYRAHLLPGAALGGFFLAFSPLLWSQATITEVYAPGLAILSLFSLLFFRLPGLLAQTEQKDALAPSAHQGRKFVVCGLVGGFGAGILPQLILVFPIAFLLLLKPGGPLNRRAAIYRNLALFTVGLALGLSVFAYLPLRAAAQPIANWGNPNTWPRFWAHISAAQYHHLFNCPCNLAGVTRFGQAINRLAQQLTWAGVILALAGSLLFWRSARPALLFLLSLLGLGLLFYASYPAANSETYLLPALFACSVFIGGGSIGMLAGAAGHIGRKGAVLLGLGLLLVLGWRVMNLAPLLNASHNWQALQFGQRALSDLPADALLMTGHDETTFSLWYQQALGNRPDVVVVDKRLLPYAWYRQNLIRQYPDLQTAVLTPKQISQSHRPGFLLVEGPVIDYAALSAAPLEDLLEALPSKNGE